MSKFLKERRKELGKELDEIASVTRIKGSYLKSIEEEEFEKLPVEVYTRGYIREYAEYLGIPTNIALEPYENFVREKKAGKETGLYEERPAVTLTKELVESLDQNEIEFSPEAMSPSPMKLVPAKLLWILPIVAIVVIIYFLWPATKAVPPAPQPAGQAAHVSPAPQTYVNPQPPPALSRTPDSNITMKTVKPPENVKPQDKKPLVSDMKNVGFAAQENTKTQVEKAAEAKWKHILNINATGRVWVSVLIDGNERKQMLLNKGDKVSYGGNKSFALIVGNASGANVVFDGKLFEDLGAEGEVVRLNFPQQPSRPAESLPSHEEPDQD